MCSLFSEKFDKLAEFIFKFYDFDKDGFITKEDIRTVLSYVPLNTKNKFTKLPFEKYNIYLNKF
jgi:Ca2+-binding EF-hand superfamily protein